MPMFPRERPTLCQRYTRITRIEDVAGFPALFGQMFDPGTEEIGDADGALVLCETLLPDLPRGCEGTIFGTVYQLVGAEWMLVAQSLPEHHVPGWQEELVEQVRPYLTS